MLLAVGTHSFLILVEIDRSWKIKDFQILGKGHHYGIGILKKDGSEFIAKGGSLKGEGEKFTLWKKIDDKSQSDLYSKEKTFTLSDNEFDHVHQIAHSKDGLFLANTRYNSIDYIPLNENSDNKIVRYTFDEVNYDFNHINSVYPWGEKNVLVLLNNKGRIESEIVLMETIEDDNSIAELKCKKRLRTWHIGCHNVFADHKILVYNASADENFVIVDLIKDKKLCSIRFPGHVKGLSVTKDYFIIGYSEFAERQARKITRGYLAIIDRHTFNVVSKIDLNHPSLPHAVGNVNEVRCLSERDYGHSFTDIEHRQDFNSLSFSSGDWKHPFVNKINSAQRLLKRGFGAAKI